MRLKFGKWKSNQLFFLQRFDPKNNPNEFLIRQEKESSKFLHFTSQGLACCEVPNPADNCIWEFVQVHNNNVINRSCYIEFAYSNMVLDVPQASEKQGIKICQYPCNNRFNQRWNLIKKEGGYKIQNLKTGLFLDVKGGKIKEGEHVIQWKETSGNNQLWKI